MDLERRLQIAKFLYKNELVTISNGRGKRRDIATVRNGLIHIESKYPIVHPTDGYELDNPMTWDAFVHLYLLNK